MSGSGARDGYGSPPWDPADPVPHPDLDDTQALPGLGSVPGPAGSGEDPRYGGGNSGYGRGTAGYGGGNGRHAARNGGGYSVGNSGNSGYSVGNSGSSVGNGGYGASSAGYGGGSFGGRSGGGNGVNGAFGGADTGSFRGPGQPPARPDETRVDLTAIGDTDGRPGSGGPSSPGPGGGRHDGGRGARRFRRRRSFWRELPVLIVVALVLALLIKSFVIQAFYIPSASMENTLDIGDRVLINKIVYHLRPIHRGDIVVFDGTASWDFDNPPRTTNIVSKSVDELEGIVGISHDSSIYIKRVIGLPGDRVACCNAKGQVTVNGVALSESSYLYPGNAPSIQTFSTTVPPGRLWVMGDHRAVSYDSRGHQGDPGGGTIPESGVLGRAFVVIWPPSRWGFLNIPATFEQPRLNASNAAAGGSSAALVAAMDNGTPIQAAGSALPLGFGFLGAVPVTLLQRRVRRRLTSRRDRRPA